MKQQLNFSIDFNQVQTPKRFCAKQNLCTILRWVTLILPIVFCSTAWAQQANMRYVASENGVFVYHFEQVPLGKGWNIYKKTAEANDYVKLNDTTIKGATYPAELVGALGDEYFRFAALMQSRNERDFFLSLQANRDNATLLSFLSPKIAKATGKLFVDNSTKPGDRVTYKIEFVDDLDRPTGKTIEKSFTIQTFTAVQPSKLVVANEGYTLKVNWEYPKRTAENDLVMHFLIMVKKANERFFESMVTDFVLRDDIKTTYTTSFQLEELNQNIEVYVVAVDATEQHGPQSTPVTYFVKDNIPPAQINEIRATMRNGQGLVTWDMVADLDLKGYQLERSTHIEKGYVPVQKGLLGPTETFFVDQTIVEGVNYFYRIAALDESGNRSAWSASVLLQVP
ncbi:MAG: hypothetical protein LAT76_05360, partial [Schleiferiaceae bacterium]|nr:hypothetical protein [Schleiferiaceae bacterium]